MHLKKAVILLLFHKTLPFCIFLWETMFLINQKIKTIHAAN